MAVGTTNGHLQFSGACPELLCVVREHSACQSDGFDPSGGEVGELSARLVDNVDAVMNVKK